MKHYEFMGRRRPHNLINYISDKFFDKLNLNEPNHDTQISHP
jgi:hypothetical protein